jgi:hypothetical protein
MKIKELLHRVIKEHPDIELSKFLHDETISKYKLVAFFQRLENLTQENLDHYIQFVKVCPDRKLYDLYAYLGYYIMQFEIERTTIYIKSLFEEKS